jgi:cytochrome bd-type quinol oxidase subunit 2
MNKIIKTSVQILTGISAALTITAGKVMAISVQEGAEAARGDGMPAELIGKDGVFTQMTNTVLYIVGIVSVIMLIYGGLRYVTSGGDSKKVTDAKNTILYAIIGLIISILAFSIVNFVINAVTGTNNSAAQPSLEQQQDSQ